MKEKHNGSDTMLEVMLQRLKTETAWMTKCFFILLSHRKSTPTPAPTCRADHRVWMSTDREET